MWISVSFRVIREVICLIQLCPIKGFLRPSLGFPCSICNLHTATFPYCDNLKFDIFEAGGVVFRSTLSCLYFMGDFHMSIDTMV